ncbi:hypothetical protein K443DRAFT_7369 [Laccaria amethystina LaAM-08-1]|uniref:Uncharacterized protein n=1 Tax=Laccaria amethystina LaAM-08-1 TaxID=1095629 RepID=A0A0C9XH48_9AGAR|nr:hypothetical protein K443DRAFT_7369 [Laccaria amethystina LaAM-08-1]
MELGTSMILTGCNDILCPVATLKNHLSVNSSTNMPTSLFSYTTASGQSKILLNHEFLNFCNHIWSTAMLAHILGHNFHIGGAVELLLAGYRMEDILPMSTSKAYKKSHIDSLTAIFEQFHIKSKIPSALITASDGNLTL